MCPKHGFGCTYKVSAWNSQRKHYFCNTQNFERIFWRARETLVKQPPDGRWDLARYPSSSRVDILGPRQKGSHYADNIWRAWQNDLHYADDIFKHIFFNENIWSSIKFSLKRSASIQGMAWCRQATSHFLSKSGPRSVSPYCVTLPQWVKMHAEICINVCHNLIFGCIQHRALVGN